MILTCHRCVMAFVSSLRLTPTHSTPSDVDFLSGLVNAMCQHVTPKLRSLWDLCSPQWRRHDQVVRTRSFDSETPNSHGSLFRRMSEDGTESLQLTRRMSIDGVHTEPLVRMMSFDGPPLARMMSVDETQATENGIDQI